LPTKNTELRQTERPHRRQNPCRFDNVQEVRVALDTAFEGVVNEATSGEQVLRVDVGNALVVHEEVEKVQGEDGKDDDRDTYEPTLGSHHGCWAGPSVGPRPIADGV
jgi:hypothetical protein